MAIGRAVVFYARAAHLVQELNVGTGLDKSQSEDLVGGTVHISDTFPLHLSYPYESSDQLSLVSFERLSTNL